jgi:hypothetical protein
VVEFLVTTKESEFSEWRDLGLEWKGSEVEEDVGTQNS